MFFRRKPETSESNANLPEEEDNYVSEINYDSEQQEKQVFKQPFYRKRWFWIISAVIVAALIIIFVPLILIVFFPMIAQHIVNVSGLEVKQALITSASDKQVGLNLESYLSGTGPFSATLEFNQPVEVSWQNRVLGRMDLPKAEVHGGGGTLNALTNFQILDQQAWADFAKVIIVQDKFTWHLSSKATIYALGREAPNLSVEKDIEVKGMNGLPDTVIEMFDLPADDPQGGIQMRLRAKIKNDSPFGVPLGDVALKTSYGNVQLGPALVKNLTLSPGENTVDMTGRLVPHSDPKELADISTLFSAFVGGRAVSVDATADPSVKSDRVQWLQNGLEALTLKAKLQVPPLKVIQDVRIGSMNLAFTPGTPYAPVTSSNDVSAELKIPFQFNLTINRVKQKITISPKGKEKDGPLASLSTDWAPVAKDNSTGRLLLTLSGSPMEVTKGREADFDQFAADLTLKEASEVFLNGSATGEATTPIGVVTLTDLPFDSTITLKGLQGLKSPPPAIKQVDVVGGQKEGLNMIIDTETSNPSSVALSLASDVTLGLKYKDTELGSVIMPNLTLNLGSNLVKARSLFDPKRDEAGTELLQKFLSGQPNTVSIFGYKDKPSTEVKSLNKGLSQIDLTTEMPGLQSKLVQSALVQILPDTPQTSIAGGIVNMSNPFTADLRITHIKASVTNLEVPVATLDYDLGANPLVLKGKSVTTSPPLPLKMNLEPTNIILILRQNALAKGMDVSAIDALAEMGGIKIDKENPKPKPPTRRSFLGGLFERRRRELVKRGQFDNFNIVDFTKQAIGTLKTTMDMEAQVAVGEYTFTIKMKQDVDAKTDDTILRLIPVVGGPIVQKIVDGASLKLDKVTIMEPTNTAFKAKMQGAITNTGPFNAKIEFLEPVSILWQGKPIALTTMPAIQASAETQGAILDLVADAQIPDAAYNSELTKTLIHSEGFEWDVQGNNASVTALGFPFTGVKMLKKVSLKGMNGLKDAVKIVKFDLPSDDPAGGIHAVITTSLTNPSNVGLQVQQVQFDNTFKGFKVAEVAANNQLIDGNAVNQVTLEGRIIPQAQGSDAMKAVEEMFNNYLHGIDTPLGVIGTAVVGPQGPVEWLSNAFKTLKLDVTLPAGLQVTAPPPPAANPTP
ncbi:uncharacterized protein VTP21DRAFT_6415 [Calcarisporiella thermophila]|uniref:uncharacterized protein n=1 Tax=Calcarisporiella thermophila TaxID=911321 RepID=UPI0037445BF6